MNILIAVAVITLVGWIALQPSWLPKPPKNRLTNGIADGVQQAGAATERAAAQTGSWIVRLRNRFVRRPSAAGGLKAWAGEALSDNSELHGWINGLTDGELQTLTGDLSSFCRAHNLDLAWLFDEQALPELRSGLRDVVTLYLTAVLRSRATRPLAALQRWQANPNDAANREFARSLYARLVSAKLVSAPGELLMAPEAERIAHVTSALQTALVDHRDQVLQLLSDQPLQLEAPKKPPRSTRRNGTATATAEA